MCGIVAIFAYAPNAAPNDAAELDAIRDRMASRGPDGTGAWLSPDGRVALGHRRLSIIDLRAVADQPMAYDNGRLRIVFNGEIYNYKEIRAQLATLGHVFQTDSDTEVLLHLYDRYGADMVRHIRGMYAFALWDERRAGMLLARDPFGIKPLYLADDGRTLRVASQVKALLASGRVDTSIEPAGHVGFFLWGNVPDPFTLYHGIRALPAGTTMWIDRQRSEPARSFFNIGRILAEAEADPVRANAAARRELLREALIDSVRHHLVADVQVGTFLSAGLDSTTIAGLATELGARNINTVTLGFREFEGGANDETALAELVARQRKTNHETRWVLGRDFAAERDRLFAAMDQPSIDGVNTYFVAKAAQETGLKVALSGLGGDELFGGYPSFRQIPRLVQALSPLAAIGWPGRLVRAISSPWLGQFTSPKYAGTLEYGSSWAGAYLLRRSLFMPWELKEILPREVVRAGLDKLQTLEELDATIVDIRSPRLKVSALELSWYMRNQLLRDSDWAGMAHSIEIRVPFVDAELFRRLAPLLAADRPPGKQEMADTLHTKLPEPILNRAKTGFVVPVREWLLGEKSTAPRGLRGWAQSVYDAQRTAA
ncbi:MAG TPA: asparagine synthase (glutamine-hydrolyzing) [Alphaproteobacteria bacterium]|nr:asparagine synthase (glutamine-hydrolyzing) [Alphaproteobacteria bacterium]